MQTKFSLIAFLTGFYQKFSQATGIKSARKSGFVGLAPNRFLCLSLLLNLRETPAKVSFFMLQ